MNFNPELRFSRQVNYPDLAWNIQAFIYSYKEQGNQKAIDGLFALDVAYRNQSKTYVDFSDKYKNYFNQRIENDKEFGKAVANAKTVVVA